MKSNISNLQLDTCVNTLKVEELEKQEEQSIKTKNNIQESNYIEVSADKKRE